jgi:hypothetical protein
MPKSKCRNLKATRTQPGWNACSRHKEPILKIVPHGGSTWHTYHPPLANKHTDTELFAPDSVKNQADDHIFNIEWAVEGRSWAKKRQCQKTVAQLSNLIKKFTWDGIKFVSSKDEDDNM